MGNKTCGDCVHLQFTGGMHGAPPYTCFKRPVTWRDREVCDSFSQKSYSSFEYGRFFSGFFTIIGIMASVVCILVVVGMAIDGHDIYEYGFFLIPVLLIALIFIITKSVKSGKMQRAINVSAGTAAEQSIKNAPSKSYKPLAWVAFGFYALWACYFPFAVTRNSSDMLFGILTTICFLASFTLGIIAIVKRNKYRPKDRPKAKFNIWALLALLIPFLGIVFAAISLTKKGYSSLSKHLTYWIAVGWLSAILALVMSV